MSREYPDWVNPWKAAEGNRSFSGTIALDRMERLAPMLSVVEGVASFEARFARDALGWATVELEVKADLPLLCQASLETYLQPVRRATVLAAVKDTDRLDELPDHYEAAKLEDGRLAFLELVQDELILAVPQVPRKPGLEAVTFSTDPGAAAPRAGADRNRPFAGLGELLKSGPDDTDQH
ncbi:MAG: hypothetical protein HKN58_05905 [Xanthomonadales bacterium]|nr:hypothetical protein [Xanthomonadales bacterium]